MLNEKRFGQERFAKVFDKKNSKIIKNKEVCFLLKYNRATSAPEPPPFAAVRSPSAALSAANIIAFFNHFTYIISKFLIFLRK